MNIIVNGQDLILDTAISNSFTVSDLLDYLEIKSLAGITVEKNGDIAEKWEEVVDGDVIQIVKFVAGG